MGIKIMILAGLLSAFFISNSAFADIIYLKNGNKVECIIIEEKEGDIAARLDIGNMTFTKAEIVSVVKSGAQENASIEKRWEEEKAAANKAIANGRPKEKPKSQVKGQTTAAKKPEAAQPKTASGISWLYGLNDGLNRARQSNKPVMIDFYTEWCGWCKKLDEETYRDRTVLELSNKFVCVKIDADKDKDLASKYKVRGYPTIIFLNSQGKMIGNITGYLPAKDFARLMKKFSK